MFSIARFAHGGLGVEFVQRGSFMKIEQQDTIVCYKDGEEMQEVSATETPAPTGPPSMKTHICPRCGAVKMIPGPPIMPS